MTAGELTPPPPRQAWEFRLTTFAPPGQIMVLDQDAIPSEYWPAREPGTPQYLVIAQEPVTDEEQAAAVGMFILRTRFPSVMNLLFGMGVNQ